jgi:hypothetical protein
MRRMLALLLAAFTAAVSVPASAAEPAADAVVAAVRALDAAIVAKDAAALEALLLPDFVGAVPTGAAFDKPAYVAYHTKPDEGLVSIEPLAGHAPVVRVFDDRFAVVNRRLAVQRRLPDGRVDAISVQRVEALVLRDGRWRIATGQGTRVQPPGAPPAGR